MFIRKYWLPLSVFLVAIVGIGLYLLATQPPKEPIVIYKVVEPEKPTKQPKAEVVEDDTSQGGHFHADGTWHAEPHLMLPHAVPPLPAQQPPSNAIDMSKLSPEEHERVMIQFYGQAGVAPPPEDYEYLWEAPWVVKRDASGKPILHKIGDPIINIFYLRGFAPTPEQYARYHDLIRAHNAAVSDGNPIAAEQALQEMSYLQTEAEGDLPVVDSTLIVPYSMNLATAKENERQKVKEALDAAYAELGLSHLREN